MTKINWTDDSTVELDIEANEQSLSKVKQATIKSFQPSASAPGFRKGKVPLSKVQSAIDDDLFKSQFLDDALNSLLDEEIRDNNLRPLGQPKVEIIKFVPFSELEFKVKMEVVGKIKLAEYKKFSLKPDKVSVVKKDIDDVIENLKKRVAKKEDVDRAAKDGDEAWIDFSGKDKSGQEVPGASGKDYPLMLGSNTFIPGFEPKIISMKPGDEKTFDVTFPKDYSHKPLAGSKVTFTVKLNKLQEVSEPTVDASFAAQVGPFKSVEELKDDIKNQLQQQKEHENQNAFKDKILQELIEGSSIPVPKTLLEDQQLVQMDEFKQNLTYRGMTMSDYLEQAGLSEEEFIAKELKPQAERKVKVGLALSEVAAVEKLSITPEEVEIRKQLIAGQSNDPTMQSQLETPEGERDIASRLLSEKTIDKLVSYIK